jgi:hypothetical protein
VKFPTGSKACEAPVAPDAVKFRSRR